MKRLRYTDSAEADLLEAWMYIAEENPDAADAVIERIDADARRLLRHPRLGRERPELAKDLRIWPTATPYIVFYLVDDAGVIVVRSCITHAMPPPPASTDFLTSHLQRSSLRTTNLSPDHTSVTVRTLTSTMTARSSMRSPAGTAQCGALVRRC